MNVKIEVRQKPNGKWVGEIIDLAGESNLYAGGSEYNFASWHVSTPDCRSPDKAMIKVAELAGENKQREILDDLRRSFASSPANAVIEEVT